MIRDGFLYLVLVFVVLLCCVLPALPSVEGRVLGPIVAPAAADVPVSRGFDQVREDIEVSVILARKARLEVETLIDPF